MAGAMYQLEMYDEAMVRLERALKIQRVARAPDHYETVVTLTTMASVELYSGRLADAERHFREALPIATARLGEGRVETAMIWQEFAQLLMMTDRAAEAVAGLRRVRAALVASIGESHPYLARFDATLGGLEQSAGDLAAAEASLRRALDHHARLGEDDDLTTLEARISLADLVAARDPAEALRQTEPAVAQARAAEVSNSLRAGLYLVRATAQARLGDRAAAEASACLVAGLLSRDHPTAEQTRKQLRALGLLRRKCR
jgi:tetratricopeptide (TPR) repeat protein